MLATFLVVVSLLLLKTSEGLQCSSSPGIGPCLEGTCPNATTQQCVSGPNGTTVCCPKEQVIAGGAGVCADLTDCSPYRSFCSNSLYAALLAIKCQVTCGLCTAGATRASPCLDTNPSCASWAQAGFCSSSFYSNAYKASKCGKTCNLCNVGCVDASSSCTTWNASGFCKLGAYPITTQRTLCGQTCGLC